MKRENFTREERRYWRREGIKAIIAVVLIAAAWVAIGAFMGGAT